MNRRIRSQRQLAAVLLLGGILTPPVAVAAPASDSAPRAVGMPDRDPEDLSNGSMRRLLDRASVVDPRSPDDVDVELVLRDGADETVVQSAVTADGGEVTGTVRGHLVQARVALGSVAKLDERPDVATVRVPLRQDVTPPQHGEAGGADGPGGDRAYGQAPGRTLAQAGSVVGEHVSKTGADLWHAEGRTGAGVRVGVVDGFSGALWDQAAANGDLPPRPPAFCRSSGATCNLYAPSATAGSHGVNVAEMIMDMAPDAELFLASVATTSDLQAAVAWFDSNGVDIISRSQGGLFDGPGNGTGPAAAVVDDAVSRGMLWVNAAGNHASRTSSIGGYWRGGWADGNGNGWLDFAPGVEDLPVVCPAGGFLFQGLRWSDWGQSGSQMSDYDLFVTDVPGGLDAPGQVVKADSRSNQASSGIPMEHLVQWPCSPTPGEPFEIDYIRIGRWTSGSRGSGGDTLEMAVNLSAFLEHAKDAYSASGPVSDSASPGMVTVGAVDPPTGTVIADYSSAGPTNDERIKPDLSAAACVTTFASDLLGRNCFDGTSAATPATSGAAALLLGDTPSLTPTQLANELRDATVDRGPTGPDNDYGTGELRLPPPGSDACPPDDFEPNDQPADAKPLVRGWPIRGAICTVSDIDGFSGDFVAAQQLTATVYFDTDTADLQLQLYEVQPDTSNQLVATGSPSITGRRLTFTVPSDSRYDLVVRSDGASTAVPYQLIVGVDPLPHDEPAGAIPLSGRQGAHRDTNTGAGTRPGEPTIPGTAGSSVWHRWTAVDTNLTRFRADPPSPQDDVYLAVAVFEGQPGNLRQIAHALADPARSSPGPSIDFDARAGTVYHVAVDALELQRLDGPKVLSGPYQLSWTQDTTPPDSGGPPGGPDSDRPSLGSGPPLRWDGPDRFATAARISREAFDPGVAEAYVATGLAFPDALAGGAVAARDRGPMLLATPNSLPDATRDELRRLQPARVTILGGPNAIGPSVAAAIQDAVGPGVAVDRHAGSDRYDTAAQVSAANFDPGVGTVYIATGENFPDALAGASLAGRHGSPVLLTQPDRLPASVANELERLAPRSIVVFGGPQAVSDEVVGTLASFADGLERLQGADRIATALAIARAGNPNGADVAFMATALDFPDALAGSAAAAVARGPMLLLPGTGPVPRPVLDVLDDLGTHRVVVLGGPAAVSDEVMGQLP